MHFAKPSNPKLCFQSNDLRQQFSSRVLVKKKPACCLRTKSINVRLTTCERLGVRMAVLTFEIVKNCCKYQPQNSATRLRECKGP